MSPRDPFAGLPALPSFHLTSDDVIDGGELPPPQRSGIFGAGGQDVSPHLSWSGAPGESRGYVVTCYDPDAPTGSGFWHWAVHGIPAETTELPTGAGDEDSTSLPEGAVQLRNDAGLARYLGAAPPSGHGPHRYVFTVTAIDAERLNVDASATPAFLGFNVFMHALARATLTTTWEAP